MLTRAEMKQRARESMSSASTHPALVTLVFIIITFGLSGIISFITSMVTAGASFGSMLMDSDSVGIGTMIAVIPVSLVMSLISFAVSSVLSTGLTAYYLKVIRHQEAGIGELFAYFRSFVKIFCLYFMVQLFISLWSLLFIIPGIIATYRYAMAVYIFIDDPEKGIMQCISESKEMMKGHKWEFFVLEISFILWYLFMMITCGIASLYVVPYVGLASSIYYDNLKYINNPNPQPGYQEA